MAATTAAAGIAAGASYMGQKKASETQADAAMNAGAAGSAAAKRGYKKAKRRYVPYIGVGQQALDQQAALAGLGDPADQQAAIESIQSDPRYTTGLEAGEEAILRTQAATGGLRSGNAISAVSEFAPRYLSESISQRVSELNPLTGLGYQASSADAQNALAAYGGIGEIQQQAILGAGQAQARGDAALGALPGNFLSSYLGLGGTGFGGS